MLLKTNQVLQCPTVMHLSMSSRWGEGGRGGGGKQGGNLTFSEKLLSNSQPPGKNVRLNLTEIPTPGNDLWSEARKKIQISLPLGQQDN